MKFSQSLISACFFKTKSFESEINSRTAVFKRLLKRSIFDSRFLCSANGGFPLAVKRKLYYERINRAGWNFSAKMCQVILTISEPVPPSENTSSAIYSDITEKAEPVPLSKNTSSAIYSDNMEKAEPVPLSKTHHQRYTPIAQKKRNQFRFPKYIISDILR